MGLSMSNDFTRGDIYFKVFSVIFYSLPSASVVLTPAGFPEVALGSVGCCVSGEEEWSKADLHPFNCTGSAQANAHLCCRRKSLGYPSDMKTGGQRWFFLTDWGQRLFCNVLHWWD